LIIGFIAVLVKQKIHYFELRGMKIKNAVCQQNVVAMWGDVLLSSYRDPLLFVSVDRNGIVKPTQRLHTRWQTAAKHQRRSATAVQGEK
jgi:hypothetical protein